MNCREFEERLDAYLAGDGDDRRERDRHAGSCESCRRACDAGRSALAALADLRRPVLSMKRRMRQTPAVLGVLALALFAGWMGFDAPSAPAPDAVGPAPAPAERNRLRGKVMVAGKLPLRRKVQTAADPVCQESYKDAPMLSEDVVVKQVGDEHRVANAVVYVVSPVDCLRRGDRGLTDAAVTSPMAAWEEVHLAGVLADWQEGTRSN